MAEFNRVQLPIYSLGSPAIHFKQHEVYDTETNLESSEKPVSANSFDHRSMIRVKELRADKNNGAVKTTKLLVTNANFNQPLTNPPGPDAYGPDLKTLNFDQNSAAAVVRSGGAFIGGGCRVSGQLSSSVAFNDVPSSLPQHAEDPQRVRFYTPVAQQPFVTFIMMTEVTVANSSIPQGFPNERVVYNMQIPLAMQSLCRPANNQIGHNYVYFVQPHLHFGRGYCNTGNAGGGSFDLHVTDVGFYRIMIIGSRSDIAAVSSLRGYLSGDIHNTGFYQEPDIFADDPTP